MWCTSCERATGSSKTTYKVLANGHRVIIEICSDCGEVQELETNRTIATRTIKQRTTRVINEEKKAKVQK